MSGKAPTHEEVCRYYRRLGLLADVDENETQAALDAANVRALEHPDVPMPKASKKSALAKGSPEAKQRMAKARAVRGKTNSKGKRE